MVKKFRTIHMPKTLHREIEEFIQRPNIPYKTVSEVCRTAGQMLINHYNLRQDDDHVSE
ncbi:MAG: ribbon-helix-helix domain-containing protein [Nitrososphaerota archaeon]|jgi:metal-responsive CopG/Arc/MetJ family transcriptional regulator|nr:ribbon-helix-helix domain-containing protein [Nitrososphaerota archaeon]